jgi:hypothetical protein
MKQKVMTIKPKQIKTTPYMMEQINEGDRTIEQQTNVDNVEPTKQMVKEQSDQNDESTK